VAGFAVPLFFAAFTRLRKGMRWVEYFSGILLILVGLLLLTNKLDLLARYFARLFPFLNKLG
jgi:hypothetical protein